MPTINAADAAKALLSAPPALPEKATNEKPPEKPRNAAMRRLWERMSAIYGHRWTAAFGESAEDAAGVLTTVGDTWQRGLTGIPESLIAAGLKRSITSGDPWPPTLPEFRARCIGIPSLPEVTQDIRDFSRPRWSPFARLVGDRLDEFALRRMSSDDAERAIRYAYEGVRELVMRDGPACLNLGYAGIA